MREKLKVNKISQYSNGEGRYLGANTVFLRLAGCNLNGKEEYEKGKLIDVMEVAEQINSYNADRLVIDGGEPLLQQELLILLLTEIEIPYVHIETNGSIVPEGLLVCLVDNFHCFPNLHSTKNDISKRINVDALETIRDANGMFEFLVRTGTDFDEAKKLIKKVGLTQRNISIKNVWLEAY